MRLNLGCGFDIKEGYVNVDMDLHKGVDLLWDLENFPYPWDDDSVEEIRMHHILEHLGQTPDQYYRIWKEIYRICKKDAEIHIVVPHPRHADFLGDPSHVRPITPDGLQLLSKRNCKHWHEIGAANTKLAEYLNVDFEIIKADIGLEKRWDKLFDEKKITTDDLQFAIESYNNVIKQWAFVLKVIKE
jgi:hypothetical protein